MPFKDDSNKVAELKQKMMQHVAKMSLCSEVIYHLFCDVSCFISASCRMSSLGLKGVVN